MNCESGLLPIVCAWAVPTGDKKPALSVLQFGQHIKSVLVNLDELGKDFITDAPLRKYLQELNGQMGPYDKAVLQVIP